MYVFERFNSWICKRALNMRYPEATTIETFIIHDWCNFMMSTGRIPDVSNTETAEAVDLNDDANKADCSAIDDHNKTDKRRQLHQRNSDLRSIHNQLERTVCDSCVVYKYSYHTEIHSVTKRKTVFTSKMFETETAKTVSSFVCCEFSTVSNSVAERNCFAYVEGFENLQFDCDTHMWYSEIKSGNKRKCSFMKVNKLSNPLVTAEEKTESHVLWFLNSVCEQYDSTNLKDKL
ncbi:hypothetical protein MAR_019843 [Mya arenaria]|uniref:Uncharacterized protein n=1 Tax=Mya arenaria TaxID=6604 RepID=A0ABY7E7T4_MYAAR|nr:hypothetical protein MAR_019843 [Mya arenaria]